MNSNQDPDLEYFRLLFDESHRGCVLLVAEKLDESLKELHRSYIRSVASPSEKWLKQLFSGHAPLSNFASKIQLGHAYGLIQKSTYEDIERIRELRNEAAHSSTAFSFQSPAVRTRVHALQAPKRADKNFFVTEQEQQAVAAPDDSERTTKLYFLLAGICLNIEILTPIKPTSTATRIILKPSNSFPP